MASELVREALDLAVRRYCSSEEQSEDIVFATVSSTVTVDSLKRGEEVEVSSFSLSRPAVSWRVKLQVEDGEVLRLVLCEMAAEDMRRLRVQGSIHVRQGQEGAPRVLLAEGLEGLDEGGRGPIVVVTDGPATIASVDRAFVSEIAVVMATFYYHPRDPRDEEDDLHVHQDDDEDDGGVVLSHDEDSDEREGEDGKDLEARLLARMGADFGNLLATQDSADVTLVVDKMPVRAHRAVLVARSAVFRQLLQDADGAGAGLGQLEVDDAPRDSFLKVLDFMYTADAAGLAGREMEVLVQAERFGLADLADVCCGRLLRLLRRDNTKALEMLAFAERHGVAPLKERALLVVVEHLAEVTVSPQWREYKQAMPSLAADLLETAAMVLRKP